jgi:ElaB/YqjD/DUF883 family membrane-anchored ribosome-binding protein
VVNQLTVEEPENEMAYETSNPGASGANATAGLSDDARESSEGLSGAAATAAAEAKAAASNLGQKATRKAEQVRVSAAEKLSTVASAMHAGGERIAGAAHRAGDALDSGAEYVRGNELSEMMDDLGALVRNHPGSALLCAAALGFVLGRAAYRR